MGIGSALDNLDNAAMADKRSMEDFSKANKDLAEANKFLTEQVNNIQQAL